MYTVGGLDGVAVPVLQRAAHTLGTLHMMVGTSASLRCVTVVCWWQLRTHESCVYVADKSWPDALACVDGVSCVCVLLCE